MITTVVLDVDDTLCLTERACFEMENEILRRMGRPPMSREVHIRTWGRPLEEAMLERSPGIGMEEFMAVYREVLPRWIREARLDVIPSENYAALDALSNAGKQLAIVTTRTRHEMNHLLAPDHLLARRIKLIYHKDNTTHHKPDPRVFNTLLQDNNLRPEECVYVGDSVSDMTAANQAGLHFIACLESGLRRREDFSAGTVDAFIKRFADLAVVVERIH